MRRSLVVLPLLALLSLTVGCPAAPGDEAEGDTETTGDGDGDGDGDCDGDGDDEGDGDGDGEANAGCTAACEAQAQCGVITAAEVPECVQDCAAIIGAFDAIFGESCAEAQLEWRTCALVSECDGVDAIEACDPLGMDSWFACTETKIPELDALCECYAGDAEPEPSDPLTPKHLCVIDTAELAIDGFLADGQACVDAWAGAWGCLADYCENPACFEEPEPQECMCTQAEEALVAACPTSN